jgi:hypothetical protein
MSLLQIYDVYAVKMSNTFLWNLILRQINMLKKKANEHYTKASLISSVQYNVKYR